ncbi:MAG: c-type cytochrome [Gammaproteobacteria bacterium]
MSQTRSQHGRILRLAAVFLCFTAMQAEVIASDDEAPSPQRSAELLTLLKHDCGSCHGMTMKGGLGPSLRPSDLAGKPESALIEAVLAGRDGTPMPPWRGLISEREARWLIRALKMGEMQ